MSDSDRIDALASAFTDGTLTDDERLELDHLLRSDEDALRRFEDMLEIQGLLTASLAAPSVKDAVIERILREHTARRKRKVLRAIERTGVQRPARRRAAYFYWAAIAASILVVAGLLLYGPRTPEQAPAESVSLDGLIAAAANAATVQDLHNLHERTLTAYRTEHARGDDCRLKRLLNLGLACAVTRFPKEDRQVEDLRFLLRQAKSSVRPAPPRSATSGLPRLFTVAEAAVKGLSPADHRRARELYEKARSSVGSGEFDSYDRHRLDAYTILSRAEQYELAHLLTFESIYIQFYLRGLTVADAVPVKIRETWPESWPYRRHFDEHLADAIRSRARLFKNLEADIDFGADLRQKSGGRWRVGRQGDPDGNRFVPHWMVVKQTDPRADNARITFGRPFFEEAIFTGQCLLDDSTPPDSEFPNIRLLIYGGDRKNRSTWGTGINSLDDTGHPVPKRWMWFLVHFDHEGSGRWKQSFWVWYEGTQPHGLREVADPSVLSRKQMFHTSITTAPLGPPAGIALGTIRAAATWRALGLRVLRPAPGAKKPVRWVDGPVIHREDFEKGAADWKACLYVHKEPESGDWISCDDAPYVRLGKGPGSRGGAQSLILDAKGLGDKSACVNFNKSWQRGPFSIEWDLGLLEGYGKGGSTHDLFLNDETISSREDIFLTKLPACKRGRWYRQRREHFPGVTPDGTPYVDVITYRDGKMQRHERFHRGMMDIYFVARFSVVQGKVAIDNMVIRKMVKADE